MLHKAGYLQEQTVEYGSSMQLEGNECKQIHTLFKDIVNDIVIVRNPFFIDFGSQTICKKKKKKKQNHKKYRVIIKIKLSQERKWNMHIQFKNFLKSLSEFCAWVCPLRTCHIVISKCFTTLNRQLRKHFPQLSFSCLEESIIKLSSKHNCNIVHSSFPNW